MTDTSAEGTQAEPEAQPQAGNSEAQAAAESEEPQPESISLDEAKKLRSEANGLRKRIKAFEDAEKTRSDSEKSESQKATDRITALETELDSERTARRGLVVQTTAAVSARKLGFRDPDLAVRLISATDVEFGEDGRPTNVERLLDNVAKEFPALIGTTTDYGGGPRGSSPGSSSDMNQVIRRAAGRA